MAFPPLGKTSQGPETLSRSTGKHDFKRRDGEVRNYKYEYTNTNNLSWWIERMFYYIVKKETKVKKIQKCRATHIVDRVCLFASEKSVLAARGQLIQLGQDDPLYPIPATTFYYCHYPQLYSEYYNYLCWYYYYILLLPLPTTTPPSTCLVLLLLAVLRFLLFPSSAILIKFFTELKIIKF